MKARISELEALLEKTLAALNKTSQTSDKPPSTDPPSAKTKRNQGKRRRKRGPKHGHKGSHRKLVPVEEVTELVECIPSSCKHCDHPLDGHDPSPQRHQVTELPPVKPLFTEYQLHKLQCSKCRKHTRAQLPEGADWSMFGPRLKATVCNLTGQYQLPKDSVVTLFKVAVQRSSVTRSRAL